MQKILRKPSRNLAEKAFDLIEAAHDRGRLAHAFLVTGPAGSGKEALVARVIQMVNPPEQGMGGANLFGEMEAPEQKNLDELEGDLVRIVRPRSKSRRITVEDMRDLENHSMWHRHRGSGRWESFCMLTAWGWGQKMRF